MADESIIDRFRKKQNEQRQEWSWIDNFITGSDGKTPKSTSQNNVELILENDPVFANHFSYNEFSGDIDLVKKIDDGINTIESGALSENFEAVTIGYVERQYGMSIKPELLNRAMTGVAFRHKYNPLVDYFEEAFKQWDHIKRSETFLPDYLGAPKGEITTLETKIAFVGAVAKAYQPDAKFDFVLDLVGGQGAGKTTLLRKMGMKWYTDAITDFKDKDNYSMMLRSLIVNDDEMVATKASSFEGLKKFITLNELEFRRPYARRSQIYKKHFILVRTTNEQTYLKDKTGERRFMPVLVDKAKQKKHPVRDLNDRLVQQLWGEFVSYYKEGFSFELTEEQEELMSQNHEEFKYVDEVENEINVFLENNDLEWVTSSDIAEKALGVDNIVRDRKLAQKIKYIMDNKKGWKKTRKNNGRGWAK